MPQKWWPYVWMLVGVIQAVAGITLYKIFGDPFPSLSYILMLFGAVIYILAFLFAAWERLIINPPSFLKKDDP